MPKKIQNTTKAHLVSVPLPNHAATYTVISHQFVIDYAYQALAAAGFGIVDEEYRCTADGQIAQGIYKLNFNNDPELSMMFAWTNSYNKQVKFKCVIGAYINQTGSVMISGDLGSWVRKHTGTADTETKEIIDNYISNAYMYYNQLVSDKAAMEQVDLTLRKQSQLLGVLFAEYDVLTTEQANVVRQQMKRPSHVFASQSSLWAFYNYVTIALQQSHPRTWMEDQRMLHYFISTIVDFTKVSTPAPVVSTPVADLSTPVEEVDPNQISLLDQIEEIENSTSQDEVIVYEDPIGNTFEVPVIEPEVAPQRVKFAINDEEVPSDLLADLEMQEIKTEQIILEAEKQEELDTILQEDESAFGSEVIVDVVDINESTKQAVVVTEPVEDVTDFSLEDTTEESFDIDFDF